MKEDTFFERMAAPTLYHVTTSEVNGKAMQTLYQSYHEWFDFHRDKTIIQHATEEINNIE